MKMIFTASSAVSNVCSPQKYDPSVDYRLSDFSVRVSVDDGELLYNTFTGAMALFSPDDAVGDHIAELAEARFMVPVGTDERAYTDKVRNILSLVRGSAKHVVKFTILTTTVCNARCFYCYQEGCKHITMTAQTAADVASYIIKKCGGEKVSISWFGGEPTCNVEAIDIICAALKAEGIAFSSSMVSNGYLFDPQLIERAVSEWKLGDVQITLDGTKEVYQRTKAYVNNDPDAFERVLDNIDALSDNGVKVFIRMNLDKGNADDLYELSSLISERFGSKGTVKARPVLLKKFVGDINAFDSADEAFAASQRINERLTSFGMAGFPPLSRDLVFQRCMADTDVCETILPDGSIEKCEHFSDEKIGSIYSDERDKKLVSEWKERCIYPECATCELYPRCIELKKCPWSTSNCSELTRQLKLDKLKRQLVAAYNEEKRRSIKETEEQP